jgi:NAD(P) transhydrogenase
VVDHKAIVMSRATNMSIGAGMVYGLGAAAPSAEFSQMFTTFSLACISGYYTVWGVAHALHSPLMSITNAISGMTTVGGMLLMGGHYLPNSTPTALAAAAVAVSSVNIVGGFIITQRMLDMFRRPTDPPEYASLYMMPAATMIGGYGALKYGLGIEDAHGVAYVASGVMCIGGIAAMSTMDTSRIGVPIGMMGVGTGIAATLGLIAQTMPVYVQIAGCSLAGEISTRSIRYWCKP